MSHVHVVCVILLLPCRLKLSSKFITSGGGCVVYIFVMLMNLCSSLLLSSPNKWYQNLGLLVLIGEFLVVKAGSGYQQDDIFEWYKLSSMEGRDGGLVICKGILEASVLH